MKRFLKNIIFYVLFFVLSITVLFIAGETGINLFYCFSTKQRPLLVPHPYLGHLRPQDRNFTYSYDENEEKVSVPQRTNSFGLMGPEFSVEKPPDTFRILIMGDSFTEAVQIREEQKFCTLLEKRLNDRYRASGKHIEIINAGVSGYSPISMYLFYKRKLAELNSDLVIVQLFANDVFEDNRLTATSLLDEDGFPVKLSAYFTPHPPEDIHDLKFPFEEDSFFNHAREFILRNSRLIEFLYAYEERAMEKSRYNKKMSAVDEYDSGHQFFIFYNKNRDPLEHEDLRKRVCGQSQKYILGIRDLVKRSGAEFMMFYIPMEAQLKRNHYSDHVRIYTAKQYTHYWNDRLKELSMKENVKSLDLLPIFQEHEKENLFFNRDGHLTLRGHELVTEALEEFLKENGPLGAMENRVSTR